MDQVSKALKAQNEVSELEAVMKVKAPPTPQEIEAAERVIHNCPERCPGTGEHCELEAEHDHDALLPKIFQMLDREDIINGVMCHRYFLEASAAWIVWPAVPSATNHALLLAATTWNGTAITIRRDPRGFWVVKRA